MRIVVGIDGSPQAREALRWASRLAAELRGDIVVVHALGLLEALHGDLVVAHPRRAEIEEVVEREWCSVLRRDGTVARVMVREGDPVDVLLDVSVDENADLVIMGSRGIGSAPALALGSTSLHVLQLTSRPVLVVPEPEISVAHLGLRRILVAVDGSPTSQAALEMACRLAGAFGAWIDIVQAIEDVPVFPLGPAVRESMEGEVDAPERTRMDLEGLRQRVRARGIPVQVRVQRGVADEVVGDVAASIDADLVVMGSHRDSADADLLAGSVSRQVARAVHRPTLVVPEGYEPASPYRMPA